MTSEQRHNAKNTIMNAALAALAPCAALGYWDKYAIALYAASDFFEHYEDAMRSRPMAAAAVTTGDKGG